MPRSGKTVMPIRLDSKDTDFATRFRAFLAVKRETAQDVEKSVRHIIDEVRAYGDRALLQLTLKFDRLDLTKVSMRVSAAEIDAAEKACDRQALAALKLARERIEAYHVRQKPKDERFTDALGVEMGGKWTAIEAVGLYVPGGTAAYPSSVLMNAVPAKVAGCARLVMVVPSPDGKLSPLVLAAAKLAGVDEIYRIGGAQAVAALAYGTETIMPVAKIVGPGNAYVAAAKRLVFGQVGIDMIAGPSEVLILADQTGNSDWIAADLLAQAEHDASAQSILITDDAALADQVEKAVESQLKTLPRAKTASASWRDFGAIILVPKLADAVTLVDQLAPEHLEIAAEDAETLVSKIRNAGAIFIGAHTPGSDRRLRRRLQPRAADRALGAFLVGSRRARFHEADFLAQMRARAVARARPRRDRARRSGGPCRSRPLGGDPPQSAMSPAKPTPAAMKQRLVSVTLDEASIGRSNPDVEHERAVAIYDLLEQNTFMPVGHDGGPYALHLSINSNRLVFDIRLEDGTPVMAHLFSLTPLRRIVKDYYIICDSYYQAIRTATPDKIEAIDMGRRAIHNDGSRILMERLQDKVTVDLDTARRLFTLICVLHWKG